MLEAVEILFVDYFVSATRQLYHTLISAMIVWKEAVQ